MAGTETTALTTEWALAELLHHPCIQQKLQTELDAVIGTARMAQESDLPNLNYLHAVVRETFRLHPPAPLMLPHSNSEPTQIDGYHIPANSHVFIHVWAIGRDPQIWSHPEVFDPDRFDGAHDQMDYKGLDFELLPFGSGRRKCPGMQSGALMVNLTIARLVHAFRWSLADGVKPEDMDLAERFGLNLQLQSPLCRVRCEPRLPLKAYRC